MTADAETQLRDASLRLVADALTVRRDAHDRMAIMRRFARLLVPGAVDACEIAIIDGDAVQQLVAVTDRAGGVILTDVNRSISPQHPLVQVVTTRCVTEFETGDERAGQLFGGRLHQAATSGGAVAVPLVAEGEVLGAMAVARDTSPLSWQQRELLLHVASTAAALIHDTERQDRSARIAGTLQEALLPADLPTAPWFELAGQYVAGAAGLDVGGDWYDGEIIDDDTLALGVGDVAGHGVHAAARMGELRSAMTALRLVQRTPDELIRQLHRLPTMSSSFATALCARVDRRGSLVWARAGHPPPILVRHTGEALLLAGDASPPLGAGLTGDVPVQRRPLEVGDTVLLYTDGLIEQRDESITDSLARLIDMVAQVTWRSPRHLVDHLLAYQAATSAPTGDDIALVACRLR